MQRFISCVCLLVLLSTPIHAQSEPKPAADTFGTLTVDARPDSAVVSIDGDSIGVRVENHRLKPGRHNLTVHSPGFRDLHTIVEIEPDEETLIEAHLTNICGCVNLTTSPPGAIVTSIPPGICGTTPLMQTEIPPDQYLIKITAKGYVPYETWVNVDERRTQSFQVNLERTASKRRHDARRALVVTITAALVIGVTTVLLLR
jgi:hypothetical protein